VAFREDAPSATAPVLTASGQFTPAWFQFLISRDPTRTETAANIADADAAINTRGKTQGLIILDTTNNRLMVARGSAATDNWDVADGSASVTPS